MKRDSTELTALGYLRISDKKQLMGESIATQKASVENYARANNIKVIQWFKDEAKSGKNADREQLQNLLGTALKMKDRIDYVIVYKMSRASRDVESYVTGIRSVLATKGIQIRSATEPFDSSPAGKFMENFYVGMAQWDNDTKREMVVDGMTRIAQQGYWQHKPPRGYDKHKVKNESGQPRPTIIPNNEAVRVRELLMRWNRGDLTVAQLARFATSIGLNGFSGKPLTQDIVHKMIKNPIYAGYVKDKFTSYERVEGRHKALITPEAFEQNQLIFKMKSKSYLLGLKHQKTNELYPLRRFVRCFKCNEFMTASKPKNSPRYYCHRPSCANTGSIMTVNLHAQFGELLQNITPAKGTNRLIKELLKRQVRQELGNLNQDISRVRGSLDANDQFRQKTLKMYINEKISEEDKNEAMSGAEHERAELHSELGKLEERQTISESQIDYALNFMGNISAHWQTATLELKQAYQELVFPNGFVYNIRDKNFITPEISPLYRLDSGKTVAINDENYTLVVPRGFEPRLPE